MSDSFSAHSNVYAAYVLAHGDDEHAIGVQESRDDLLEAMVNNPDYHPDAKRNGVQQGMMFTRSGEQHSYNVICRPGDVLFAGDIVDAFGQKWIVMEARADDTTHVTGVMRQCNKLMRFQCFGTTVYERWVYIDVSGYSSAFNSDSQLQKGEEQVAIYMSYDAATAQIYVDQRLPSHIGYDEFGNRILNAFRVTGPDPVSESFNPGDHLLVLKAVRDLYHSDTDNLELEICDYRSSARQPTQSERPKPGDAHIEGRTSLRIGTSRLYTATFLDAATREPVANVQPLWTLSAPSGITVGDPTANPVTVIVANDASLIGEQFSLKVVDTDGVYSSAVIEVEVRGIG